MDFETINALSQKEMLLLLFGFFLGVSTRIGGYVFSLSIKPLKMYIKARKKKRKKARKKLRKQAFIKWKQENIESLSLKQLEKLIASDIINKQLNNDKSDNKTYQNI